MACSRGRKAHSLGPESLQSLRPSSQFGGAQDLIGSTYKDFTDSLNVLAVHC